MTSVELEPPSSWRRLLVWAVGGLFQVGFAENSDLLLVLSSQGRGIFDCTTGQRLARDDEDAYDFFDPIKLTATGFDELAGQTMRMAGLYGGGLPLTTQDNWLLEAKLSAALTNTVYLIPPNLTKGKRHQAVAVGDDGVCELRAYGFSETGRSFIIATSCDSLCLPVVPKQYHKPFIQHFSSA